MLAAAHLRVTHLLIAHLIHRVLLVMLTSGLSHFAGVHLRLISAHVFPVVALMLVLHLVFVACDFSGSAIICSRASALLVTFTNFTAVIFTFSGSGSRTRIGTFLMLTHGPSFVSGFSSSRSCSAEFLFAFPLPHALSLVE